MFKCVMYFKKGDNLLIFRFMYKIVNFRMISCLIFFYKVYLYDKIVCIRFIFICGKYVLKNFIRQYYIFSENDKKEKMFKRLYKKVMKKENS